MFIRLELSKVENRYDALGNYIETFLVNGKNGINISVLVINGEIVNMSGKGTLKYSDKVKKMIEDYYINN